MTGFDYRTSRLSCTCPAAANSRRRACSRACRRPQCSDPRCQTKTQPHRPASRLRAAGRPSHPRHPQPCPSPTCAPTKTRQPQLRVHTLNQGACVHDTINTRYPPSHALSLALSISYRSEKSSGAFDGVSAASPSAQHREPTHDARSVVSRHERRRLCKSVVSAGTHRVDVPNFQDEGLAFCDCCCGPKEAGSGYAPGPGRASLDIASPIACLPANCTHHPPSPMTSSASSARSRKDALTACRV